MVSLLSAKYVSTIAVFCKKKLLTYNQKVSYNLYETFWLYFIKGEIHMNISDIQKNIVLHAPIDKVWKTVATAEGIATWFMPNDFQAIVGHTFHLQSPFGPSPCKVLEIDEPHKLVFSWDTAGWIVTFELKELDGKTAFLLTHGGWGPADAMVDKAGRTNEEVRNNMASGWDDIVNKKLKNAVE